MLSMALGVMLVVAVLSIHGVVSQSFRNNASLGYNMIVGAKGGQEQLVLNTVYYLSQPVENIPYTYYLEFLKRDERDKLQAESFAVEGRTALRRIGRAAELASGGTAWRRRLSDRRPARRCRSCPTRGSSRTFRRSELGRHGKYGQMTELAIPLCLGDYFGRFRVVGTTPALFDDLVYDIENNRKFEFAQGRNFEWHDEENGYFEAVVGATVAREMGVKVGRQISPAHGDPEGHQHARKFTVVGILAAERHAQRPGRLRQHGRLLPDGRPRQAAGGAEAEATEETPQADRRGAEGEAWPQANEEAANDRAGRRPRAAAGRAARSDGDPAEGRSDVRPRHRKRHQRRHAGPGRAAGRA